MLRVVVAPLGGLVLGVRSEGGGAVDTARRVATNTAPVTRTRWFDRIGIAPFGCAHRDRRMLPAIGLPFVHEDTRPLRPDTTAFATRRSIDGGSVSGEALTKLANHGVSIRDGPGDSGLFTDTLFMVNPDDGQLWLADGPIQPVRLDTSEAIDPAAPGVPDQTGQWPATHSQTPAPATTEYHARGAGAVGRPPRQSWSQAERPRGRPPPVSPATQLPGAVAAATEMAIDLLIERRGPTQSATQDSTRSALDPT